MPRTSTPPPSRARSPSPHHRPHPPAAVVAAAAATSNPSWASVLFTWAVSLAMGVAFGFVIDRSGVASPVTIRRQFVFDKLIMLKMFLAAAATSAVMFSLVYRLWPEDFAKTRKSRGWGDKGLWTMLFGGAVQGAGMAISGACPGMVMAQMGARLEMGVLVYMGGLVGALMYGLLHPVLERFHVLDFDMTWKRFDDAHLDRVSHAKYDVVALPLAMAMLALALGLDRLFPWRQEIAAEHLVGVGYDRPLNPILAGMVVGALQFPAFLLLNTFLGASSAYNVVTSQYARVASEAHRSQFKYIASFLKSKAYWQFAYGIGAVVGAYISSQGVLDDAKHVRPRPQDTWGAHQPTPPEALLGGLLLVFGARFAGGCASGHGLTSFPLLSMAGFATVPSLFGGAIATALAMRAWRGEEFLL